MGHGLFKNLNILLFKFKCKGGRDFFWPAMAGSRLENQNKEKMMASIKNEDLVKEAFSANLIYRLLKNQRFVLTGRLREFFHLFQVPEVRQSIFVMIIELKFIFEDEIKEYFKADEGPCKK